MGTPLVGLPQVKSWLDLQERSLQSEAQAYGLIGHASSVGTVREFLVSRVLRSLVPPGVHFSAGRILSFDGSMSGQIDILLIDPRFPVFESPASIGIYVAESVIAAIEVKSRLTTDSMTRALQGLAAACTGDLKVYEDTIPPFVAEGKEDDPKRWAFNQEVCLKTFLFALSSDMTPRSAATVFLEHVRGLGPMDPGDPRFPRVIVAGDIVGIVFDANRSFEGAGWRDENGTKIEGVIPLAGFWRTTHRFGTFAANVAISAIDRLGPIHARAGVRYAPEAYLPIGLYAEEMRNAEASFAVMKPTGDGEWELALASQPGL